MLIAMAQINPTVGDVEGNRRKILSLYEEAARRGAGLIVFPELALTGYPPKDLLEKPWFLARCRAAMAEVAAATAGDARTGLVLGAPMAADGPSGKGLYNAAVLLAGGRVLHSQAKSLLPSYDVFDEARYFDAAPAIRPVDFNGLRLGLTVCEDAWNDPAIWPGGALYDGDPVANLVARGAALLVNISASPFHAGKEETRFRLIAAHARRHGRPFLYVNQTGANDELIFDGRSFAVDGRGRLITACPAFEESLIFLETDTAGGDEPPVWPDRIESIRGALALGIRDYLRKTGFSRAVVGLSGGIDSALTCCLAAEALGPANVLGISMPSRYSSIGSIEDSRALAANLGVEFRVIPIEGVFRAYLETLEPHFAGQPPDVAEENIQARIRGNILMAFANKFGHLVLSTGNKSELAVGYCTLYGDMSGGLSVLADVPKTMVYQLAEHINRERETIPRAVIEKAPSAELRPEQRDQDTLPPYPVLDAILHEYIEEGRGVDELAAQGYDPATVHWVVRAVNLNEYKRRQAAPGLRVTSKAFGVGRRMPIAAKY